jgi:hypothetical protein
MPGPETFTGPPEEMAIERRPPEKPSSATVARSNASSLALIANEKNYPLAALSEPDFEALLVAMRVHNTRVKKVQRELMEYGVHYGVPGMSETDWKAAPAEKRKSPALYKSGVELLLKLMRFTPAIEYVIEYGDPKNEIEPAIRVRATCRIHQDNLDGPIVAMGVGTANSWETKYRWRSGKMKCPDCGNDQMRFQREAKRGDFEGKAIYWCPPDTGCGRDWLAADPGIANQGRGRVPNPDALDLENTLVKIAAKRSRTDGTILATQSSDIWTQDTEDLMENRHDVQGTATETSKPKPERKASPNGDRPATENQKTAIGKLLASKKGVANQDAQDGLLAVEFGATGGMSSLTVAQASELIGKLNILPNATGEGAKTAPSKPAPTEDNILADTIENRQTIVQRILDTAGLISKLPNDENYDALLERDGMTYLSGDRELEAAGFPAGREVLLADLDVARLSAVIVHMHTYVRQVMKKPAPKPQGATAS